MLFIVGVALVALALRGFTIGNDEWDLGLFGTIVTPAGLASGIACIYLSTQL